MKTFLDSGVLLTAWKGKASDHQAAMSILHDSRRSFVTGQMVKLELIPKPAFFKKRDELEFYQIHFAATLAEQPLSTEIADAAFELAKRYGLAGADALNIAAALKLGAEEFITTELPGKPLFRVAGIKVTTLHAAVN